MNSKQWIKNYFLIVFLFLLSISLFNIIIDPLGIFKHSFHFNSLQNGFNERLQKTAQIKYKENINDYNTILLGSSRVTYYNKKSFGELKVFNYSFSDGNPNEYSKYIEFTKELKNKPFKNIILGLDFFSTSLNNQRIDDKSLELVKSNKVLLNFLSFDLTKQSIKNIKKSINKSPQHRAYTREDIAITKIEDKQSVRKVAEKRAINYKNYENYYYNEKYKDILLDLKDKNKTSNFIIFTTPLSKPFLNRIFNDTQLYNSYYRWIKDMVYTFDEIYFFTYKNKFSEFYDILSKDGDHYYPESVKEISTLISGEKGLEQTGIIINHTNLDEMLEYLKKINGYKKGNNKR